MRHPIFLSIFLIIFSATAVAAGEEDFTACLAQTDDTARLACYDQAARAIKSAQTDANADLALKPTLNNAETPAQTASVIAASTHSTAATQEDNFGLSEAARQKKNNVEDVREITAKVAEISFLARGELKVTLDNGQVWQQLSSDTAKVRIRSGVEYSAIVRKASFSSHVLKLNNSKKLIRVRRIK